jgi:hypothetical protein
MHVGEISFCNRIGFNIKSDEFKKKTLEDLARHGCKIIQKHHDRYNDQSLSILNMNPHLMTMRTNGNPYYLFLTKFNGIGQCIFVDKKVQQGYMYPRMVIVKFWMDDDLFQDTLFSGEMVKSEETGQWTYLVHDILADGGAGSSSSASVDQNLHGGFSTINLVRRINRCHEIISKLWIKDERQDVCDIRVKRYWHYQEYNAMIEWSRQLPYSCRGIYFKPLFLKFRDILYNFDEQLIVRVDKNAPRDAQDKQFRTKEEHDEIKEKEKAEKEEKEAASASATRTEQPKKAIMQIQKTSNPDIYQVFTGQSDGSKDAGMAFVNNIKISKMLRERFEKTTPIDKIKFMSVFNERFSKWEPIVEVC